MRAFYELLSSLDKIVQGSQTLPGGSISIQYLSDPGMPLILEVSRSWLEIHPEGEAIHTWGVDQLVRVANGFDLATTDPQMAKIQRARLVETMALHG